jgi:hypothetical protein
MIDLDNKILPITIMNAKNKKMEKLRDISIVLSMIYVIKDDKLNYISKYFNIDFKDISLLVNKTLNNYYTEILHYQDLLKNSYGFKYGWDVEQNCELTQKRLEEIQNDYPISRYKGIFNPTVILKDCSIEDKNSTLNQNEIDDILNLCAKKWCEYCGISIGIRTLYWDIAIKLCNDTDIFESYIKKQPDGMESLTYDISCEYNIKFYTDCKDEEIENLNQIEKDIFLKGYENLISDFENKKDLSDKQT